MKCWYYKHISKDAYPIWRVNLTGEKGTAENKQFKSNNADLQGRSVNPCYQLNTNTECSTTWINRLGRKSKLEMSKFEIVYHVTTSKVDRKVILYVQKPQNQQINTLMKRYQM